MTAARIIQIETSRLSAHFANQSDATHLDVFSCKAYNPEVVREFSQNYFGGKTSKINIIYRH
nr:S-adenosylmethionine decarboxylase [uncultured Desulfobacter sp.]